MTQRSLLGGLEQDLEEGTITPTPPQPPAPSRVWSPMQQAVFDDTKEGEGHTVIEARAGSGKTSTIVEALKYVKRGESCTFLAFNKSIATELVSRVPQSVRVKTFHSYGFGALQREFGRLEVQDDKERRLLREEPRFSNRTAKQKAAAVKVTGLAKANLLPSTSDPEDSIVELLRLLDSQQWVADFEEDEDRVQVVEMVLYLLERGKDVRGTGNTISFDDMCWIPAVLGLSLYRVDRLFSDESQDASPCQHWLIEHAIKASGRLCAIGDSRQAIYQFRGADKNSMAKLEQRFGARQLPLSITYRCPRLVVEAVHHIVGDLEAAPNAPDGIVEDSTINRMLAQARPGDFVLSRTNAPLIKHCLELIKQQRRATILGRNIGKSLLSLVENTHAGSVDDLETKVRAWADKETERLLRRDPEAPTGHITDRRDCVLAVADSAATIDEVLTRIEHLFDDGDPVDRVTFSSTHRAKGLERDRVWMLRDTYMRSRKGQPSVEEQNLFYVACTRAKRELYFVRGE